MTEKITYTAKEAAEILGVSVQTIYRRLQQLDGKKEHQLQVDGIKHITAKGIELIGHRSATAAADTTKDKEPPRDITAQLIDTLQAQLIEKDKQIAELSKLASAQATLLAQRQQLDLLEADSQALNDDKENVKGVKQDKPPLLKRLRNMFKR